MAYTVFVPTLYFFVVYFYEVVYDMIYVYVKYGTCSSSTSSSVNSRDVYSTCVPLVLFFDCSASS